ncbi:MAG: FtsH protease activity modulator HflK, partial [Janthinobacterium lividum]
RLLAVLSMNGPRWLAVAPADRGVSRQNRPEDSKRDPGKGPPDLDELWRDFNKRLNKLFGGKRPGGGTGLPSGAGHRIGIGIVIGVIIAIWLGSGIFVVQEGQAGVVLRFGRYVSTAPAGFQWHLPYPFESAEVVNMSQVRSVDVGRDSQVRSTNLKDASMLTQDENIIDVRFTVQYRVADAAAFLFNNANPDASVSQAAQAAVREIVGKNTMDYLLYQGREQLPLDLTQSIQRTLDGLKAGILVTGVVMQSIQPPAQAQAAFDDAVKAGQDGERLKNEAQAYANDVVPRAQGTASRMLEEAQGYKSRVVAQADGDARRFIEVLGEYAKAPAITRERMYLQTMQQIFSTSSKVLVDSRNSNNLINLPLDKLLAQSAAPAVAAAPAAPPVAIDDSASAVPAGSGNAAGVPPAVSSDASNAATGTDAAMASDAVPGDDTFRSRNLPRSRDRGDEAR